MKSSTDEDQEVTQKDMDGFEIIVIRGMKINRAKLYSQGPIKCLLSATSCLSGN